MKKNYLIKSAQALLNADDSVRINHIEKDIWIGYSRAQHALETLNDLFSHPKRSRMPNLLIIAPTNNGKSMLLQKFFRDKFPDRAKGIIPEEDLLLEVPVISMQMPPSPDVKRFYLALLEKIDYYHGFSRCSVSSFETHVYTYLTKYNVRMLIIDEIHNILAGTYRQQIEFLNILRFIGNEIKIPVICAGTKEAYLAIRSDPQLENRFEPYTLPLWKNDEDYEALLASFATVLPLKRYSNLNHPSISNCILAKGEGIIGEIVTFIKRAAILAIKTGQEYIDEDLLNLVDYHSPSERKKMYEREIV